MDCPALRRLGLHVRRGGAQGVPVPVPAGPPGAQAGRGRSPGGSRRPTAACRSSASRCRRWSARTATSCVRCAGTATRSPSSSRPAAGMWFTGPPGTGKTTLAMLISKHAMEADRTVAIYSLPRLLAMLRETFRDDAPHSLSQLIDMLCSRRPAAHRRRRRRADVAVGARAALHGRQHALRGAALDHRHHEPDRHERIGGGAGPRAARPDRRPHGLAPVRDVR